MKSNEYFSVRVRLGGSGSSNIRGYVEGLGTNGEWGGICKDGFDINDANVICRMLGFSLAKEALADGTAADLYGTAPSGNNFVLDQLDCFGNEHSVFDCPHDGEWNNNCGAGEIVGVECSISKPQHFFKSI